MKEINKNGNREIINSKRIPFFVAKIRGKFKLKEVHATFYNNTRS